VWEIRDLKKAAHLSANKNAELVSMKDILELTGYIRGGCSPVGIKKLYPTYWYCLNTDDWLFFTNFGKMKSILHENTSYHFFMSCRSILLNTGKFTETR
jgi:hypothetical protein